jgi:hypothetical protein
MARARPRWRRDGPVVELGRVHVAVAAGGTSPDWRRQCQHRVRGAAIGDGAGRQVASSFPAALRNSCQEHGGSWEFMDRSVDALRAKDGRYGYNAKRGNMNDPSLDAISYFWGNHDGFNGSTQVYIFDLIAGHCGSTPSPFWGDVTDITYSSGTVGRAMYPRPGRNVTSATCQ